MSGVFFHADSISELEELQKTMFPAEQDHSLSVFAPAVKRAGDECESSHEAWTVTRRGLQFSGSVLSHVLFVTMSSTVLRTRTHVVTIPRGADFVVKTSFFGVSRPQKSIQREKIHRT